jgi:uncharacterized protein YegJ (DUF2314 family)
MTIKLTDAQEMHRQYPVTFQVPTEAELDAIKPGDCVKAGFIDATGEERMWVLVLGTEGDRILGTLNNYPVETPMEFGQPVNMERRHVCAIWERDAIAQ